MDIQKLPLEGLLLLKPRVFGDQRGYFMEAFNEAQWAAILPSTHFIQDNESYSSYGVVRGLHLQRAPWEQAKLVRVLEGRILDVAVDLRPGPGQGKWHAQELSEENKFQFYIPAGFAHGFCVLSPHARILYKVDAPYRPEAECSIAHDDAFLGIPWPIPAAKRILSPKDRASLSWATFLKTLP